MGKTYFAHSKMIYGKPLEKRLMKAMQDAGIDVLDPNTMMGELGSMKPYLKAVRGCDQVLAHSYKGYIGRGVYEEVKFALAHNIPCYRITHSRLFGMTLREIHGVRVYEITNFRIKYGKLIL
jgi:hypothetical protein